MKKKCDWCLKPAEVKNEVESVFHKHHSSHKIQKHIKFVGHFETIDGKKRPKLCLDCQIKVIRRGMAPGGMWG